MATLTELIKRLKDIKDGYEAGSEIADKIQDVIDRLEANEPTSTIVARLLADLIEKLGGELGPLGSWIAAYAQAFRDAIDSILGTVYGRYKRMRDTGFTHEEATGLSSWDPEVPDWLRFKYEYENMPEPEEAEEPGESEIEEYDDLETPGEPTTPPPAPPTPPEPLWPEVHHDCCKDLSEQDLKPVFNLIGKRIYRSRGSRYMDFTFEVTHRCGLRGNPRTRFLTKVGSRWVKLARPNLRNSPYDLKVTEAVGGKGKRYAVTRMQVMMGGDAGVMVDVRAISNCIGLLNEQRQM